MKAAILVEQNKPLQIDDVEMPAVGHGQVRVRLSTSGICGSQLNEIDGTKGKDRFLPHLLGHEGSGTVEEIGPGVTRVAPGDAVVLHWRKGAGIESATPTYKWRGRALNAGWVTTFNELAVVSENRMTPIPKDVDRETAVLYGCAVTSAFGIIHNDAQVKIGESVAVFGTGGVGLCVALGARLASAYPIIAVDQHPKKLELARQYGATHTFCTASTDPAAEIRRLVGDEGLDVAVDCTGVPGVIEQAYELTGARGRTILVGVPRHDEKIRIHSLPLHFEKRLSGSHGGDADPSRDIPRYLRLEREGHFDLKPMISHRYALEEINEAIAAVRRGEVIRAIVKFGDGT